MTAIGITGGDGCDMRILCVHGARDVVCCPIFTNSFVEALNAKNTRGFGINSKGENTRYKHTQHDTHPNLLRLARKTKSNRITERETVR